MLNAWPWLIVFPLRSSTTSGNMHYYSFVDVDDVVAFGAATCNIVVVLVSDASDFDVACPSSLRICCEGVS